MKHSRTSEAEAASKPSHAEKRRFALVGAGALGTALAVRLVERGYKPCAVLSRTEQSARRLAAHIDAPVASTHLADLPLDVRLVFCAVPDDLLSSVAEALADGRSDWSGCLVAHTSGALTAGELAPLRARGAATLSFHPMQTFPPGTPPEAFEDIYIGLEGTAEAVAQGMAIAADLGATSVVIPSDKKALYHLAATCASNFLVTLIGIVGEILAGADVDEEARMPLIRPLVERTWRNLQEQLPGQALTGPIARGDRDTVAAHTEALADHLPHLRSIYTALTTETVHLAARSGHLSPAQAQKILDALKKPRASSRTSGEEGDPAI